VDSKTIPRSNAVAWLVVAGFILRASPVLNIGHEIWHVIGAELDGADVLSIGWWSVTWRGARTDLPMLAGYWGEMLMYVFYALVWKRGFAAGALVVVYFEAFISNDFHKVNSPANYFLFAVIGGILLYKSFAVLASGEKAKTETAK